LLAEGIGLLRAILAGQCREEAKLGTWITRCICKCSLEFTFSFIVTLLIVQRIAKQLMNSFAILSAPLREATCNTFSFGEIALVKRRFGLFIRAPIAG
jgi:hypothetical protein